MTKSFRDEYGTAVDLPVNAVAYELTERAIQRHLEKWLKVNEGKESTT